MRRLAAVTGVCVLVAATAALVADDYASASASASVPVSASASASSSVPAPVSVSATPKSPPKMGPIKHGSAWTLMVGTFCERDSFAMDRAFSALDPDNGDQGVYREKKKTLTMTWKAGVSDGAVFKGTFSRADGYTGTFDEAGQSVAAYLVPSATFGCVTLTTAPKTPSVEPGGNEKDTATGAAFSSSTDGPFCFDGVYSGDTHYPSVSDGSTTDECFTVGS